MSDKLQMAIAQLKFFRNEKLRNTDIPWGLADFEHPNKAAWLEYRQALRDIAKTSNPTLDENNFLQNVDWPVEPTQGTK